MSLTAALATFSCSFETFPSPEAQAEKFRALTEPVTRRTNVDWLDRVQGLAHAVSVRDHLM